MITSCNLFYMRILVSWLGRDELRRFEGADAHAPLTEALVQAADRFEHIVLLNNLPSEKSQPYVESLACRDRRCKRSARFTSRLRTDSSESRWNHRTASCRIRGENQPHLFLEFRLQPMGAVWLLLGKSRYAAELLAWSTFYKRLEQIEVPLNHGGVHPCASSSEPMRRCAIRASNARRTELPSPISFAAAGNGGPYRARPPRLAPITCPFSSKENPAQEKKSSLARFTMRVQDGTAHSWR